jgi:glycerol uptake facilitator-like aquaporin
VAASLLRRLGAEFLGTGFLLAAIVGSGIMADRLSGGNVGLALLAHGLACGEILFVLILMMAPVSGAHFNPAVTLAIRLRGEMTTGDALAYFGVQIAGAIAGMLAAHMMFAEPVFQLGNTARTGGGQWFAEAIATFGLVLTVLRIRSRSVESVAAAVGIYVAAAVWFTASMCFANPAVTIARSLTATFTGIRPADMPGFVLAEFAGALLALLVDRLLFITSEQASRFD